MDYVFYYIESNLVCIIIFSLILLRNTNGVDRQERQLLFDLTLMFHIAYFVNDAFWALIDGAYLPKTSLTMGVSNVLVFILAECIGFCWFLYSEHLQGSAFLSSRRKRMKWVVPLVIAGIIVIMEFLMGRGYWIDDAGRPHDYLVYFSLLTIPISYLAVSSIRALIRARNERNDTQRRQLRLAGTYPIVLVVSAALQMSMLRVAVLCFGTTIAVLNVYLNSLDSLVSLDPLTQLNNRNQLNRYLVESADELGSSTHEHLYVLMLDLDRFKLINDRYGHLDGDRALTLCADALRAACAESTYYGRPFIARYGGDEFIVVAKVRMVDEVEGLCTRIRAAFDHTNATSGEPWQLATSIGYAEVLGGSAGIRPAISAADQQLYEDKQSRR